MADRPDSPPATDTALYRHLCEQAAVALVAADGRGRVLFRNAAAGALLGGAENARGGALLTDWIPPDQQEGFARAVRDVRQTGRPGRFEVRLAPTEDRAPRELLVELAPLKPARDAGSGVAAWFIDRTDLKRLAGQLAQTEKMASLGTLARGVAHHFNNILGGMTTLVDYALTSEDPVAMKRGLERAAEAVTRASRITQSLLSFAREDATSGDLADLTEVVLTFAHLIEQPLAEAGIAVELDLQPVRVLAVEANRMHEVLGRVLTNAEEAMPNGGTVRLSVRPAGEEIEVSVQDTGEGIAQAHLPLVFEPFFTTKGVLAGGQRHNPGLGLSVVHGIMTEMGGRVWLVSRPGEGTTVRLRFPVDQTT